MRHSIAVVFVLLSTVALQAQDRPRGQTVEKQDFPVAGDRKITLNLHGIVKNSLGGLPEDCGPKRIYDINSQLGSIAALRKQLDKCGVDYSYFQYVGVGYAGADATLIRIDDGRVSALEFFFPHLSAKTCKELTSPIRSSGDVVDTSPDTFQLISHGTRLIGIIEGRGITGEYHCAIEIGIHKVDWYLAHHHVSDEVARAMKDGHLAKGMTMDEAYAVYDNPDERLTDNDGNISLTWHRKRRQDDGVIISETMDAHFKSGVITSFEVFESGN